VTLCPDDFSKSGISATIAGCKATAHRSLISAALAVLPAVMPNKASPKALKSIWISAIPALVGAAAARGDELVRLVGQDGKGDAAVAFVLGNLPDARQHQRLAVLAH